MKQQEEEKQVPFSEGGSLNKHMCIYSSWHAAGYEEIIHQRRQRGLPIYVETA